MQHDPVPPRQRVVRAGLVGRGIGGSRTPAMHMAEGTALGIAYDYTRFDMDERPGTLADVFAQAEAEGFAGLNVTFPYKVEVTGLLDTLSENARALGAVNTVVFRDGHRYGHNTDMWGFAESFRCGMVGVPTEKVLLLGAGGAGMAVGHALLSVGTRALWVHDTNADRAAALAGDLTDRFGAGRARVAPDLADLAPQLDGVVNATPVGMDKLPGCAFPSTLLRPDLWVADIVYFPLQTALLAAARAAGCRVLPGSGMAVFQAVRAFELITGLAPNPDRMRATFESFGP